MIEKLHENEKKVVRALMVLGKTGVEEISKESGLKKDEIERACLWARAKGILETEEIKFEFLELTEEGIEYVRYGLPEKNLIQAIDSGINEISKIKDKIERAEIGIIWARKNGWIEIKEGKIFLTDAGEKAVRMITEGEELIKRLMVGRHRIEEVENIGLVEDFIKRGIIKKVVEVERNFFLSELGKSLSEKLKEVVEEIGQLTPEIIKTGEWKNKKIRKYDVFLPAPKIYPGKIHPYRQIIDKIRKRLIGLGFVEARGPFVELNFWNCDALFMPSDHPARSVHDIYTVKNIKFGKVLDKELWERVEETHKNGWITGSKGWGNWDFDLARRLILRSHGTAVSSRTLYSLKGKKLPHKMFMIDRVFRPDVIDAKHFIEFEHCEGIVVGEDLNLRNLLGFLKEIAVAIMEVEKVRFKPSFFPFTEPSVEGIAYHPKLGWFEFGGAGIFRPEVTVPLGIEVPVLAWGLGIGRMAMVRLGVEDIRYLYSDDLNWLRNKELVI